MKWGELWERIAIGLQRSATDGGIGEFAIGNLLPETIAALVTFFVGWVVSSRVGKQRRKDRIVDELLASQRELVERAYPEIKGEPWGENAQREAWMLDPFVSRIRFLVQSLNEDVVLPLKAQDCLDRYIEAKEAFVKRWASTHRRGKGYHEDYKASYRRLRETVGTLSPKSRRKLRGLLPERFMMDALYVGPTNGPANEGP